jgi:hypothetical protein
MGVTSGAGTAYPSGAPEFIPGFSGVRVTRSLVLYVCFVDRCLSFCAFFFWPLCCLFFFDIRILISPLVSSNSSYRHSRTLLHKIYIYNPIIEYILNFVSYQLSYIVNTFLKPLWVCLKKQTHTWCNNWVVNHVCHAVLITDHNPIEVICTLKRNWK